MRITAAFPRLLVLLLCIGVAVLALPDQDLRIEKGVGTDQGTLSDPDDDAPPPPASDGACDLGIDRGLGPVVLPVLSVSPLGQPSIASPGESAPSLIDHPPSA